MKLWAPRTHSKGAEGKRSRGLCCVRFCNRTAVPGRSECSTCKDRKWRSKHPEHHLWNNLKKSARRRGIQFTITLEEFKRFCAENDLVARVGRNPEDLTVDRRKAELGYSYDNLRALTNAENGRLGGLLSGSGHRDSNQQQLSLPDGSRFYSEEDRPF